MTTSNILYTLTSVRYKENSHEVICSFSSAQSTKSQRYTFFPVLLANVTPKQIFELLSPKQSRQIQVIETKKSTVKIMGASFSLLQSIKQLLEDKTNSLVLLLEPERQFLLHQDWGFFDGFLFSVSPEKVSCISLPNHSPDFLPFSFKETIAELLESNETETAKKLCISLAWSNILKVPLSFLPSEKSEKNRLLLENQFFLSGVLFSDQKILQKIFPLIRLPLRVFENTAEFDFSASTSLLCTKQHYNLGLESNNCDCCKPLNAAAHNLFPDSIVKVRILSNAFFFDSLFESFAMQFHNSHAEKTKREKRQKEFGLFFPPIGPFFSGSVVECPLADAEKLEKELNGVIFGLGKKVHWFCLKKESALSKTLNSFSSQIRILERKNTDLEKKAIARDRVLGLTFLEKNPFFFFQKTVLDFVNGLFELLPRLFLNTDNANQPLFSGSFADSVSLVQQYSLKRFVEFTQSNGFRALSSPASNKVFIQETPGFGLAKAFANTEKMPIPRILGWHFGKKP